MMTEMFKTMVDGAVKLSRSPLGVIGLSFVFLYAIAAFVATSSILQPADREKLVWLLVAMPPIIFLGFCYLVAFHYEKLFAPSDFNDESNFMNFVQSGTRDAESINKEEQENPHQRSEMELKILTTLWTHQINLDPKMSNIWTFKLSFQAKEFLDFHAAANRLMGEGYVGETDNGQVHLTDSGFEYCKQHYKEFRQDKWWSDVPINEKNLEIALSQ